ncbi:MAG: transcriptional repressor [Candidatus Brocadiia bacterium]|jgi:Fe2+ or Zn2+ uptake regulation protein
MCNSRDAASGDVMQLLSDICRQAGLKLTRQRVEVLRELAHSGDGATVDKIDCGLQARLPALSRKTVRRTLGDLERVGIVREIDNPAPRLRRSSKRG